ncbi:HAD-IC family P-type ATPase [Candidatus Parcubacteria bacterium]|nr:HAD-IC family P-type ATPase [Candidatus Parcubacteria bacterium]
MSNKIWHNLFIQEVVKILKTDRETGLSNEEMVERQKKFGLNKLPEEKHLSKIEIFFEQFKSPLIYILIIAGIGTAIFQLYTDSIVILAAVVLNTIFGYFQENKASQALRALKKVVKVEARVIREGRERKINAEFLVPGDIIVLSAGDRIPADGRLIENYGLRINESPLTGEWLPAKKTTDILPQKTSVADRDNMVYMGCIIEDGKGRAVITEIAKNTEIGKVASLLKETKEEKTPLQKRIALLSKKIGLVITIISVYIFLAGLIKQQSPLEMFEVAVAVAVAAIPEGLPIAVTVILALGMTRILKRKGLVRKLLAAETLGSTSLIATDKTLTLTEGKMEATEIVSLDSKISLKNIKNPVLFKKQANKEQLLALQTAVLCSEAFVENPQDLYPLWQIQGKPTDKAFVLAGARLGLEKPKIEKEFLEIDKIPFNSKNKFIATLRQKNKKENILYVSGAPEKIISFSSHLLVNNRNKILNEKLKDELNKKLEGLTKKGLRVVATAHKKIQNPKSKIYNLEEEVKDLTFLGFITLKDPVREEVKEAMKTCIQAGMKPIIVTGDHKLTAKAVAQEIGFKIKEKNIIEGKELDEFSDEKLERKIKDIQVYARVEPEHKLRIIQAWQKKGEVVAMTGDGINDAPALKKADIGVALGSGTDCAKEVSDLILLTDNFNIIVAAIEEGRAIIDNIRKVITYLLSSSFTETILIGVSIVLGLPLPVIAVQILWVNLIEDGLPSIALTFEPKEKDLMKRKPQGKDSPLLTKEMKALIFIIGLITDILLLGLFLWLLKYSHYEIQHIQSIIFAALAIDSLFYIFSCKSLRKNIWHINLLSNKFLIFAWIAGFFALLASLYLPVLQTFLRTVPLNSYDWKLILGVGFSNLILIEATKWYFITKKQKI